MKQVKIVFPEYKNEIINTAIAMAKEKYGDDFIPVNAESLEEACEKVKSHTADSMIAGIDYTSRDVILACKNIIGMENPNEVEYDEETKLPLRKIFSASFILTRGDEIYVLGDAAACKNPDKHMLKSITLQTYETAKYIFDARKKHGIMSEEAAVPRIAMLSFSTLGSGGQEAGIERAKYVVQELLSQDPSLSIDGELQLDAAINPAIGNKKAPGSTVAGRANVLIAPDLNAGNILYKAMEQFGGFTAAGPILQGFASPVSDLSRGSTVDDVLAVIDAEIAIVCAKEEF